MTDDDAHHHLARPPGAGVRAVHRFGAQQLHRGAGVVRQAGLLQQAAGARQNGFAGAARFGGGVDANDQQGAGATKAVHRRGRNLVLRTRCAAQRAADADPLGAELRDLHLSEIAAHIGQRIRAGVANLIKQLLGHGGAQNFAAGARGLVQLKAAVGIAVDDGVADVRPIRNVLPIGVQTARGLATAFNDVPG